jgi:predicted short-subunit dehydrogenase-like oxidoreductase (DUF2520 family)
MRLQKHEGLIGAGGVSQSFLARMPRVLGRLGPVKASSLRISRRIANSLRAGIGVEHYSAFEACGLIWICVPEPLVDRVTAELAEAIPLQGKMVVLCDVMRDSLLPSPLRTAGARLASINVVPETDERMFVAEGDNTAVTEIRKLLEHEGRKLIELRPAAKALYFAGTYLGSLMVLPWIAGAVESLRASGFTRVEATRLVQGLGTRAIKDYSKAGAKAWNHAEAHRLQAVLRAEMEAIRMTDPRLAMLCNEAERAAQFFTD